MAATTRSRDALLTRDGSVQFTPPSSERIAMIGLPVFENVYSPSSSAFSQVRKMRLGELGSAVSRTPKARAPSGVSTGGSSVLPPSVERLIQTLLGAFERPFSVT